MESYTKKVLPRVAHFHLSDALGIDGEGVQIETYPRFDPHPLLKKLDVKFTLRLRDRDVWIQAYQFDYLGNEGKIIPIYFLDTDFKDNFPDDRNLSLRLYYFKLKFLNLILNYHIVSLKF